MNEKKHLRKKFIFAFSFFTLFFMVACSDDPSIESASAETSEKFSCETKSLDENQGLAIYCGGDSIGVVMNGSGCNVEEAGKDSVVVTCGTTSFSIPLNKNTSSPTSEDKDVISNLKLSGFSQKGPFVNGSTVMALELENGTTLNQTGKAYNGEITSDNGQFNINVIALSSQYAIIRGSGYYLNEVTGEKSNGTLTLNAITDLTERNSVNINVLTHLEYFRVQELVKKQGKSLSKAKEQAEKEIFEAFHINSDNFSNTEDLNIFASGDGNAALLAISILLQRDNQVAEMTQELSDLSNDLKDDGLWNGKATYIRERAMLWVTRQIREGRLQDIRDNVADWKLGTVPDFEKFIQGFFSEEMGLKKCTSGNVNATAQASDKNFYKCTMLADNDFRWVSLPSYENDIKRGISFSKDNAWDASLGASFPFEYEGETYNAYWNVGEWAEPEFDPGYILWPVTTSTGKDGLQKVVNYCQGFCGNAKSGSYGNFYGISLVLDNDKNFDISSWGGLCIEAESAFYIELLNSSGKSFAGTGNSFNDRNNAILNIPWSAFDILKTEDSKIFFDLIQETKEIIVIPNNGDFHISKIGAYGSCGGNPEPSDYFECNEENEGKLYKFENSGYIENRYYKCQNSAWKEISSHEYNVGGISEEGMVGNCKFIESTHVLYLNSWFQFHTDDNNWHLASISDCTDGFSEGDIGYEDDRCYRFDGKNWQKIDCSEVK